MPEMTGENISQNQTKDNDVNMSARNIQTKSDKQYLPTIRPLFRQGEEITENSL